MSKIFILLALLLIVSGAIVLAIPAAETAATTRSLTPEEMTVPALAVWARDIADQVQAPLSIVFGLVSLYWNRKNYLKQQAR
jgi:Zn-dependent protease with chaperone function